MTGSGDWSEQALRYQFSDVSLLDLALTHRSAAGHNNERLEFLGDAVLGHIIARAVYDVRPDADEGTLSRFRSRLVRGETLAAIAAQIGVAEHIVMGPGEYRTGGHRRASVLANAVEALFGAILLDGGFTAARDTILHVYAARLADLPDEDELKDPKTRLQEYLQARQLVPPDYELLHTTGAEHARRFEVLCRIDVLEIETTGMGTSRRKAEQAAARAALDQIDDE